MDAVAQMILVVELERNKTTKALQVPYKSKKFSPNINLLLFISFLRSSGKLLKHL